MLDLMGDSGGFLDSILALGHLLVLGYSVRAFKAELLNSFSRTGVKASMIDLFVMEYACFKCCKKNEKYKKI